MLARVARKQGARAKASVDRQFISVFVCFCLTPFELDKVVRSRYWTLIMKANPKVFMTGLIGALVLTGCAHRQTAGNAAEQTATVRDVLDAANKAVEDYQNSSEAKASIVPELKKAEFTFQVTNSSGGGLDANILLAKASGKISRAAVSTATYTYQQPQKNLFALASPHPARTTLAKAIAQAVRDQSAKFGELHLEQMTVDLTFTVEMSASGGVQFPVLTVITAGPSVALGHKTQQKVSLVFGRKKAA
jgi:hypothetical protein